MSMIVSASLGIISSTQVIEATVCSWAGLSRVSLSTFPVHKFDCPFQTNQFVFRPNFEDCDPKEFSETYIRGDNVSLVTAYAQELFSLFVLGAASQIDKVNGVTMQEYHDVPPETDIGVLYVRKFANTVFDSITKEVVDRMLATSTPEAEKLILPAFARYGLLPTPKTEQPVSDTHQEESDVSEQLDVSGP